MENPTRSCNRHRLSGSSLQCLLQSSAKLPSASKIAMSSRRPLLLRSLLQAKTLPSAGPLCNVWLLHSQFCSRPHTSEVGVPIGHSEAIQTSETAAVTGFTTDAAAVSCTIEISRIEISRLVFLLPTRAHILKVKHVDCEPGANLLSTGFLTDC